MGFVDFIEENIWAPIVAGVALLVIFGVLFWYCCLRNRSRQGYTAIGSQAVDVVIDNQVKQHASAQREGASLTCRFYLRSMPQYRLVDQLGDVGSRMQKYWFVIKINNLEDQMMSMQPRSKDCCIPPTKQMKKTAMGVFTLVAHHPYVTPITEIDMLEEHDTVVFIQQLYVKGSLKDLIHGSNPIREFALKYRAPGSPLPSRKIAQFGRQILEGMLFIKSKELPYGHLHTGNVFFDNGVCRVGGYENALFGYKPKLFPLLKGMLKQDKDAGDVLSFGHVLYEMAMGYELAVSKPDVAQLVGRCPPEVIEVLAFIFHNLQNRFPSLEEVVALPFFASAPVRELETFHPPMVPVTSQMKEMLKSVKSGQLLRTKTKRRVTETSLPVTSSVNAPVSGPVLSPSSPAAAATHAAAANTPLPPTTPASASARASFSASTTPGMGTRSVSTVSLASEVPPTPPPSAASERGALLNQIHQGTSLRKTRTNDRSAPRV